VEGSLINELHQPDPFHVASSWTPENFATLFRGDCLDMLASMPDGCAQLAVTSPPYNLGKEYETPLDMGEYVSWQVKVAAECARVLEPRGSLCWQVGNHVRHGGGAASVAPLDCVLWAGLSGLGLTLRNRIVWAFEHGMHCSRRFSGRHEAILWFTKAADRDYIFDLDPVRVPQKYPGKRHFKGAKAGQYSGNPAGKNPGDFWLIPNVKANHVEKTPHPCQFPVELAERLVLSLTEEGGLVVDPFAGSGSALVAAARCGRRSAGAEVDGRYCEIAADRLGRLGRGELKVREMGTPVHVPSGRLAVSPWGQAPGAQGV
jgi:adenine-specific DNA-methyltransferase